MALIEMPFSFLSVLEAFVFVGVIIQGSFHIWQQSAHACCLGKACLFS